MNRLCRSFLVIAVLASLPAAAVERVLLPVAIQGEVPGAFGSRWVSELVITNTGLTPAEIGGSIDYGCWGIVPCMPPSLPARATAYPRPELLTEGIPAGFLFLHSGADALAIHLRVQDVSRQAQTWGTEVPVVRESDAFTTVVHLQDVPVTPGFRQLLRIYGFDGGAVRIRVYRIVPTTQFPDRAQPDELLGEHAVALPSPAFGLKNVPAYAQIDLADLPASDATRVRLEIESATEGLKFWAMVSVTNNETQHVTLITPARLNP
jgi:hypothetical protein